MGKERSVCAAIVTYNRKELLHNLLNAYTQMNYKLSGIVIVDNMSEDGTDEELCKMGVISSFTPGIVEHHVWNEIQIYYYRNTVNSGGSGGFAKALEIAKDLPYDCIWIMDDDVCPQSDCLSILLQYLDEMAGVVVPSRGDENYEDYAIQTVDLKSIRYFHGIDFKRDRIHYSQIKNDYVYVEDMTFEGPLLRRELIEKVGLPNRDYFILFDDTDYAHRLGEITKIRYVRDAKLHRMLCNKMSAHKLWNWKDYYNFRNAVYFDKTYGETWGVRYIRSFLRLVDLVTRAIVKGNFCCIKWLLKGYAEAIAGKLGATYKS